MSAIDRIGLSSPAPQDARKDDQQLAKAARQFEAVFAQKLLSTMRKMVPESSLFPKGSGHTLYDHMMDSEVSQHMTRGRGMGIAQFLFRQWTGGREMPASPVNVAAVSKQQLEAPVDAIATAGKVENQSVKGTEITKTGDVAPVDHMKTPDGLPSGRIDNELELLRNLLPPNGLEEKNNFFLNQDAKRHDHPSEGLFPIIGVDGPSEGTNDGHQEDDRLKQPGTARVRPAEAPDRDRRIAVAQYRSIAR